MSKPNCYIPFALSWSYPHHFSTDNNALSSFMISIPLFSPLSHLLFTLPPQFLKQTSNSFFKLRYSIPTSYKMKLFFSKIRKALHNLTAIYHHVGSSTTALPSSLHALQSHKAIVSYGFYVFITLPWIPSPSFSTWRNSYSLRNVQMLPPLMKPYLTPPSSLLVYVPLL